MKNYLFPFFGAGDASYFEFISLNIFFQKAPNKPLIKKIIELLPNDYQAEEGNFEGHICSLYYEYGYTEIRAIYDEDFTLLNESLENALEEIHTICPIVFAYRPEDTETSGTIFSNWHKKSKKMLPDTIAQIENSIESYSIDEVEALKKIVEEILDMYNEDSKILKQEIWNPFITILQEYKKKKKTSVLAAIFKFLTLYQIQKRIYQLEANKAKINYYDLLKNTSNLLLLEATLLNRVILNDVLEKTIETQDIAVIEKFKEAYKNSEKQYDIFDKSLRYDLFSENYMPNIIEAIIDLNISFLEIGVDKPEYLSSENFVNTLHFLIPSNNKSTLPKNKCFKLIDFAMPYAPQNPTIYWNSYCLYASFDENDLAFECIENTITHNLSRKSLLNLLKELQAKEDEAGILSKDERYSHFLNSFEQRVIERTHRPKNIPKEAVWTNNTVWKLDNIKETKEWLEDGSLLYHKICREDKVPDEEFGFFYYGIYDYTYYYSDGNIEQTGSYDNSNYKEVETQTLFRNPNTKESPKYHDDDLLEPNVWKKEVKRNKKGRTTSVKEFDKNGNLLNLKTT